MMRDEVFGTEDQQAVLRRGRALHCLLKDDPRYTYYGRTMGLATPEDGNLADLLALARVQGNANVGAIPKSDAEIWAAQMSEAGYVPMLYDKWEGDAASLAIAKDIVLGTSLADDLALVTLDPDTGWETVASLAKMALGCGVLPLHGAALRGQGMRAICILACDQSGAVVACAASAAFAHPAHPTFADQAWWGMLATGPTRRGAKLALLLGAHAMIEMEKRYGFTRFMTGVEPGNAPSEAVCARMGLARHGMAILGCADPLALRSGRMTK